MSHYLNDEAALAAASDAAEAAVELIRYAREGDHSKQAVFGDDVATKLAAALLLTIELETDAFVPDDVRSPHLSKMRTSIREYLQGEGHEI